ncbi:MAG: hypothetical protein E6Q97_00040 [Desulfurellales bacterium]|nr:MAG: hypothetical protein E6Q97_00040 [Desulfurellales bacterium]
MSRYKVADGYHEAIVGARTDAVTAWNTVADALVDRAKNAIAKTKKGDVMAKPREGDVWKTRSGCALWQVVGGLHWCVDTDGTGPQVDDGETFYFFDDNDVIVDSNTTTKRKAKR